MIDQPEILVLLRLMAAHIFADFMLQPYAWISEKRANGWRSPSLFYHAAVVGVLTWIFLWDFSEFLLPLVIMVTHFLIDWWKVTSRDTVLTFVADQAAHIVIIIAGWMIYTNSTEQVLAASEALITSWPFWVIFVSYLIISRPAGYLIAAMTRKWQEELDRDGDNSHSGLENAGMWIGLTERFIILTFILLNQFAAIGFLIAAKSVFRFSGRMETNRDRKETEYILIGTLISFIFAIVTGGLAIYLLS